MLQNRAAWLAILVLAIASAIMFFFVMPRLGGDKNSDDLAKIAQETAAKVTDAAKDAAANVTDATKDTVGKAADAVNTAAGGDLLQKMDRLKADASTAAENLQALFANGKVPSEAELADAKAKLVSALQSMVDVKAPDGTDPTVSGILDGFSANAAKAMEMVKSIPENSADAIETVKKAATLLISPENKAGSAAAEAPVAPAAGIAATKEPAFDILRVEKDGSTVIAGSAVGGAKVEILDDGKAIGAADAGAEGDFAIVLDTPLGAGDHTLILKSTAKDGTMAQSSEVATVSVPNDASGKLLAMVSKPGEASRILTKPEEVAQAAVTAPADATTAPPAADSSLPPLPAASSTLATTPPLMAPAASDAATSAPAKDNASASVPPADNAPASAEPAAATAAEIRIDAVEIEGNKIYVAGTSIPNAQVHVYADDKLIEASKASAAGNFVAQGIMELSVGNHIIRADVMDASGAKVVVRASVPFNRPEGDQVSVVADAAAQAMQAGARQSTVIVSGQLEQLREEAAKALVLLKGLFADGKTPAKDQLAAAKSACEIAFKALIDFKPQADAGAELATQAADVAKSAQAALDALKSAGEDPASVGTAIAAIEAAAKGILPTAEISTDAAMQPATSESAASQTATAGGVQSSPPTASSAEAAPKSVEQAPLKESKNSVIIRKGDTLWQISRRVYGRGIRYTTIYLANQGEIVDPNLITPGQVFGVPDEVMQSDNEAEQTNRKFQKQ